MIGDFPGTGVSAAIAGYESLVAMFGSPAVLTAISCVLIVIAIIEQYVRNCGKRAKEAV